MNDELMTLIDARGRTAGSAVQRAASTRSWTAPPPKRPVVWVRPALVMATLVAVIAGLVWVSGRPAEPADQRDPNGLRYVIGEVPNGWGAPVAQDADAGPMADPSNIRLSLFGTRGDPTAPLLQLAWQDPSKESDVSLGGVMDVGHYDNIREINAGEYTAACGDLGASLRCAMDTANGVVQATAIGLSDTDVGMMLTGVTFVEGDTVIEAAVLPDGMTLIAQGGFGGPAPVLWAPMSVPGASIVVYAPATGDGMLALATGWADENELAAAATWGDIQRVEVAGRPAFLGESAWIDSRGVFWIDGDRAFALTTSDRSVDLLAAAASVRQATADEWAAIVVDRPAGSENATPVEGTSVAVPETTALGASSETTPPVSKPVSTDLRDVAITQTVRPISEFDASYSAELPDGTFGEIQIAVVADTVLARDASGSGGSFSWALDGVVSTDVNPFFGADDGIDGVIVKSTDPAAVQLRVIRQNGERYLLDLVTVKKHPGLKVGVVMLPPNSVVSFDVVDADGNVLASIES